MKMYRLTKSRGQSILEYSLLAGCVVAAFVVMQIYIKRGIQGRLKVTADQIGEQYAPKAMTTDINTKLNVTQTIESSYVPLTDAAGNPMLDEESNLPVYGNKRTITVNNEAITRSGSEALGEFEDELFK
jgi:hypothetical protein